ncbi:FkbM family methyltransferase [Methylobacterium sp. E-066]|uniref:FkbM family methyltransferase n=1 Tax=Methylobacterium sp. E-066 TaxID=2836584 RepID=UPI001FB9272C|nr:FkbM family methyltransferase [Methylobacterium sp. E-066]MCJ2142946.1 FkbM family methyltransferase [Methylobacterium sp. E-066]
MLQKIAGLIGQAWRGKAGRAGPDIALSPPTDPLRDKVMRSRDTILTVPFSSKQFRVEGSETDISVFGPIAESGGIWEPHIMKLMASLVRPGDTCFDIGANIGVHSIVFSELVGDSGQVYSFEPSSVSSTFLQRNVKNNELANVKCFQIGFGRTSSRPQFTHFVNIGGCSFVNPEGDVSEVIRTAWNAELETITETVQIESFDTWCAGQKIKRIDVLKLDAEGSEIAVIEGGLQFIRLFKPAMIVELNVNTISIYYKESPVTFFELLASIYNYIYVIDEGEDIQLSRVTSFAELESRLAVPNHWWVDLLCLAQPYNSGNHVL